MAPHHPSSPPSSCPRTTLHLQPLEPRLLLTIFGPWEIANALDLPAGVMPTYSGDPEAVRMKVLYSVEGLLGFPVRRNWDNDFLMLSSGIADEIDTVANSSGSQGTDLGAYDEGGDTATVSFAMQVPLSSRPQKLRFDFLFLSEEYPEFVGSQYDDFFTATVNGENIALDQFGNTVSVNNVFFDGNLATTGTFFDGRTAMLTASYAIPDAVTSLNVVFSVGDVGDGIYDSAVLLDAVRIEQTQLVYLNFDGQTVWNTPFLLTRIDLPPFSPADVDSDLDRSALISETVAGVSSKYASYDLEFVTVKPPSGPYSTVVIGGDRWTPVSIYNPLLWPRLGFTATVDDLITLFYGSGTLYGVAEGADVGNRKPSDVAVVFSGNHNTYVDNVAALVNTIAHELGHNLGLRHISDEYELEIMQQSGAGGGSGVFHDQLMDLAEQWADGATQQNSHEYLDAVLGPMEGGSSLALSYSQSAGQVYGYYTARLCLENGCNAPLEFRMRVGDGSSPLSEKGACEGTN